MEIQFNTVLSNQFNGLVTYIKVNYLDLDYNTEKLYIYRKILKKIQKICLCALYVHNSYIALIRPTKAAINRNKYYETISMNYNATTI